MSDPIQAQMIGRELLAEAGSRDANIAIPDLLHAQSVAYGLMAATVELISPGFTRALVGVLEMAAARVSEDAETYSDLEISPRAVLAALSSFRSVLGNDLPVALPHSELKQ